MQVLDTHWAQPPAYASCQGVRIGRSSSLFASSSLTNCSRSGSQFNFRFNRMAIFATWQRVAVRCPASTGLTGSLRDFTESMKLRTWSGI